VVDIVTMARGNREFTALIAQPNKHF